MPSDAPEPSFAARSHKIGAVVLSDADSLQTCREKLARIVLDEMYQFVGLLDADGMTLEINRAALDGAGLDLDEIRGKPFWRARWFAVSEESMATQREFVRRARQGEFVRCDIEIYGKAAGEETIIVDFSLLPVRDDSGAVRYLLAEGRNITEKKRAEAEIARKNTELQALLERVRHLDQLKSDLFANVSHELRTPLALILGTTEELLGASQPLSEEQQRGLQVARRNAVALLKHVNDLLDVAKLDARKMIVHYARVDLAVFVRVVGEQFQTIAKQHGVSFAIIAPPALSAEIDVEKIERVLLNLLSNAFKFTSSGGRIRCALEAVRGDRALLSIQDSGPGIAAEMREAIFERFRQVQEGTTRDVGGTGLGLAISKDFVELHQGVIGVTEAPGGGALFQVEIPLSAPPGTRVGSAPVPSDNPAMEIAAEAVIAQLTFEEIETVADDAPDGCPTVFIVEDNAQMRRFVRDALSGEFRVVAVADGQQALERAAVDPPDVVVTDLMMPRLGGDRLVRELRAQPGLAEIPVLVLSARDDDVLRARLLAESVQDYVTKPFSAHELLARVRNLAIMKRARDLLQRELASQSQDLTELMNLLISNRHALKESEQRWWAIYEHSPVGIALTDVDGMIQAANPAFRSMIGYEEQEIVKCSLQRITPVEDRAATQARLAQLVGGDVREYHVQRRFQRKDGSLVWANTSVSSMPDQPESNQLLVVVAEDITGQKRAQEALVKVQNELARVGRVSTLGELAASIAHEVNQPLAAIVANGHACARWLNAEPPDESEAQAAVQRIVRDANRASEVITRIRAFLKRGEMLRESVYIDTVIGDVLALLRSEAASTQITLRHSPAPHLPQVMADRVQVQQVVLNLVMNGIEAICRSNGGFRVLELSSALHADDAVRIDVRDTGVGIEPPARARVFDAFHTTKPEGMGMGLAISRSIVEAHGGRLWCSPNDGPGMTFSFTLPLAESSEASS